MTKIRIVDGRLEKSVQAWLYGWSLDCFRARGLSRVFPARRFSRFLVLEVAGVPAGACGLLTTQVTADGQLVEVLGFGGVIVRPEYQRRGYGTRLYQEARSRAKDVAGLLAWCQAHLADYWSGIGAEVVRGPVTILSATGKTLETPQSTLWTGASVPSTIAVGGWRW